MRERVSNIGGDESTVYQYNAIVLNEGIKITSCHHNMCWASKLTTPALMMPIGIREYCHPPLYKFE